MAAPRLHRLLLLLLLLALRSHATSLLPLRKGWSFQADLSLPPPLPLNGFPLDSPSLFIPVLTTATFSSDKGFALGFLSFFPLSSPPSPSSARIFLAVCLGTSAVDSAGMALAVPVWTLPNDTSFLKQAGSSGQVSIASEDGSGGSSNFVLRDGDGSVVWRVANVVAMEIQEDGNWVFYNSANQVAWQSFDHPGDTLLQGQKLSLGMKLVSIGSLFTMEMLPGGLLGYMQSEFPSPLYYWGFPANESALVSYIAVHYFDLSADSPVNLTASFFSPSCPSSAAQPFAALTGTNLTVKGNCSSSLWNFFENTLDNLTYPPDFVRLNGNGIPSGYTFLRRDGRNVVFSAQAGTKSCLPPDACGAYGICESQLFSSNVTCVCPSAVQDARFAGVFRPVDPSDMSQGCVRSKPLQCQAYSNVTFGIIKGASVAGIHFLYETMHMNYTIGLDECTAICATNCSCSGFLFAAEASFCVPFNDDSGSLSNLSFIYLSIDDLSVYVKLQPGSDSSGENVALSADAPSSDARGSKAHFVKPLALAISAIALAILLVGLSALYTRKHRRHGWRRKDSSDADSDPGDEDLLDVLPMLPTRYSYKELHVATKGFKNLLGTGAHSRVYEGVLRDGRKVAVKRLDQRSPRQKQFLAEVATISGINHYNIVRLYGFCSQRSRRLLVYENVANGSLDNWLFCKTNDRLLSWRTRFSIALGSARGLAYLHGECVKPIIHFDVKPQNILLDESFVPKVSDFGLAKLTERESSSFVMTAVRGTPGYLAPEWLSNSVVSKKCDVYSYGMVLFELVGGRRNAIQSLMGSDEWYFPAWAAVRCQDGGMLELVDKKLEGKFDKEQVKMLLHLAFLCIQRDPHMRPTMEAVCKMLEGLVPIEEKIPYSTALFEEPLSPAPELSLGSCSNLREGR